MRLHHWILSGLLTVISPLPQALAAWDYWGIVVHNNWSTNISARYEWSQDGASWSYLTAHTVNAGGTDSFESQIGNGTTGNSPLIRARNNSGAMEEWCRFTAPQSSAGNQHHWFDCYPAGGSAPHNYCCVYCFTWTNTGTKYAAPAVYLVDGTNTVFQEGFVGNAVAPGVGFARCYTNCYGATAPAGGCGYGIFGDTRDGATVPDSTATGTLYDYGSGSPGNGSGGTSGQGPIVGAPGTNGAGAFAGGTTNPASQADIYKLGDSLVKAIADNELTTAKGLSNVVRNATGNTFNLLTNLEAYLSAIAGNTAVEASNTASFYGMLSTNLSGLGTNLASIGTNLSNIASNSQDVAGLLQGITNGVAAGISNALWFTNMPLFGLLSNYLGVVTTNIAELETIHRGLSSVSDDLYALGNGTTPDDSFAVLQLTDPYGRPLFGALGAPIDFKPSISLQKLEDKVPGFRSWFKIISLWAITLMVIFWYAAELRLALFQALAIPAAPGAGNVKLLAGIGALGGPIGATAGAAAGLTLKVTSGIIILAGLIFAPTLLVNLITTIDTVWPSVSDFLAANPVSLPGAATQVVYLISQWFAIVPLMLLAFNTAAAMFGLDNTVSLCMVYLKIAEE